MNIVSLNCIESKSFFGSKISQIINNWQCQKYEFKSAFEYSIQKKKKKYQKNEKINPKKVKNIFFPNF